MWLTFWESAQYAGKQLASGRRSTYEGQADALCPAAQLDSKTLLTPIQQEVVQNPDTSEVIPLVYLLADSQDDPAQTAARNLDWTAFLWGLDGTSRKMLVAFAHGDTMRDLKPEIGLSGGRKRKLVAEIKETLGPDRLADAASTPDWRADIIVHREKGAYRREMADV